MEHKQNTSHYDELVNEAKKLNNTLAPAPQEEQILFQEIKTLLTTPIEELSDQDVYYRYGHLLLMKEKKAPFQELYDVVTNVEEQVTLANKEIEKRQLNILRMCQQEKERILKDTKEMNTKLQESNDYHEALNEKNTKRIDDILNSK